MLSSKLRSTQAFLISFERPLIRGRTPCVALAGASIKGLHRQFIGNPFHPFSKIKRSGIVMTSVDIGNDSVIHIRAIPVFGAGAIREQIESLLASANTFQQLPT